MPFYPYGYRDIVGSDGISSDVFSKPMSRTSDGGFRLFGTDDKGADVFSLILYGFNISSPIMPFAALFYILPTIISPFISSVKRMVLLGSLLLFSLIISKIFFEVYTISVWCFFAAIISSVVFMIISKLNFVPEIKSTSNIEFGKSPIG